jgi:hypothetical protein
VNYLFFRGIPVFFLPLAGATNQQALDNTIAAINANAPVTLTASYCLGIEQGDVRCGDSRPGKRDD